MLPNGNPLRDGAGAAARRRAPAAFRLAVLALWAWGGWARAEMPAIRIYARPAEIRVGEEAALVVHLVGPGCQAARLLEVGPAPSGLEPLFRLGQEPPGKVREVAGENEKAIALAYRAVRPGEFLLPRVRLDLGSLVFTSSYQPIVRVLPAEGAFPPSPAPSAEAQPGEAAGGRSGFEPVSPSGPSRPAGRASAPPPSALESPLPEVRDAAGASEGPPVEGAAGPADPDGLAWLETVAAAAAGAFCALLAWRRWRA